MFCLSKCLVYMHESRQSRMSQFYLDFRDRTESRYFSPGCGNATRLRDLLTTLEIRLKLQTLIVPVYLTTALTTL